MSRMYLLPAGRVCVVSNGTWFPPEYAGRQTFIDVKDGTYGDLRDESWTIVSLRIGDSNVLYYIPRDYDEDALTAVDYAKIAIRCAGIDADFGGVIYVKIGKLETVLVARDALIDEVDVIKVSCGPTVWTDTPEGLMRWVEHLWDGKSSVTLHKTKSKRIK